MKICFYNMNHIGDAYIFASLLNRVCELNKDVDFYYYVIQGDIFFNPNSRLKNQHKLGGHLNLNTRYKRISTRAFIRY